MKIIRGFLGLFAVCCLLAGCASSSPAVSAIMKHDVNGLKKILDSLQNPVKSIPNQCFDLIT